MATTILRTPPNFRACLSSSYGSSSYSKSRKFLCVSFVHRQPRLHGAMKSSDIKRCDRSGKLESRLEKFVVFTSNGGESTETQTETQEKEQAEEPNVEGNGDGSAGGEDTAVEGESTDVEGPSSTIIASLQMYRGALANSDETKVAEIEALLISIEDEKVDLEKKVATLTEELSYEKARVLRISADFDNFRKRTERERLSLVTNAQGEVVENLLPVLDNFERAKAQIKIETEGEEKINNSYQSIYKQFVEILGSLGVVVVKTVGKPFDPMMHEAIMREESTELEDDVIIEEYRKGFKLGDRLLRPSMVKVSAGPGPAKPETLEPSAELESINETREQETTEPESAKE